MFPNSVNPKIRFNPIYSRKNVNSVTKFVESLAEFPKNSDFPRKSKYIYKNPNLKKSNHISVSAGNFTNSNTAVVPSKYGKFTNVSKSSFSVKNTKLQSTLLQKKSKYKWESQNNATQLPLTSSRSQLNKRDLLSWSKLNSELIRLRKITLASVIENFVNNHYRSSIPFYSTISKGWFSRPPCNTECVNSKSFDIQSCCFINERYLPENTLNMNKLVNVINNKTQPAVIENNNSFVKISEHKLVRKPEQRDFKKPLKIEPDASIVLCTKRKLIREPKSNLDENRVQSRSEIVTTPKILEKLNYMTNTLPFTSKRKRLNSSSIVLLTKRKLVRKQGINSIKKITKSTIGNYLVNNNSAQSPEKLIRVNRNKLIRSSLLQKSFKHCKKPKSLFANSVLHHMIQNRRRPYPGSSYILLSRNKLIKKQKFRNKTWKKQAECGAAKQVTKKVNLPYKTFVSLGSNKLIRKSLFTKTNKISNQKRFNPVISPLRKKHLIRGLYSPCRRVQRFTNHLSRMNLKYFSGLPKFPNRCKYNRSVLRKKKNNIICPVFRKKGECSKHNNSNCSFLHDKKYVALCHKYLRSNCDNDKCLLSHELIPQKVPVCLHFLNNSCEFEECPYLHVKPDVSAPICAQFLRGYCESADKCSSWHLYACPDYKKLSKCSKGDSCHLPHRDLEYFEGKIDSSDDDDDNVISWRYFEKNKLDEKEITSVPLIPERHSLGVLPDYIPL